jgi:hypothetical protein
VVPVHRVRPEVVQLSCGEAQEGQAHALFTQPIPVGQSAGALHTRQPEEFIMHVWFLVLVLHCVKPAGEHWLVQEGETVTAVESAWSTPLENIALTL